MKSEVCLIVLTYKSKILLFQKEDILKIDPLNTWKLIEKKTNKLNEKDILNKISQEINADLTEISFVTQIKNLDEVIHLYHAKLTDTNVNEIQRSEGLLLQFFTLSELTKLKLNNSARFVIDTHFETVKNLLE